MHAYKITAGIKKIITLFQWNNLANLVVEKVDLKDYQSSVVKGGRKKNLDKKYVDMW